MTPQELELERARKMFAQKVERLQFSRERLQRADAALEATYYQLRQAVAAVEHDVIMVLAAAEDILQDKEEL